jgi:hypothetical protein
MNRTIRASLFVLAEAVAATAAVAAEGRATVGWLLTAPEGRYVEELTSPALVKTVSEPMVVELDGGRRLAFDANSAARLERLPSGVVRVHVLSGRVSIKDGTGETRTAGARSVFHVDDLEHVPEIEPANPRIPSDERRPHRAERTGR